MKHGLVIDDDKYFRDLVPELILSKNISWESADCGPSALQKCIGHNYDIIICDWHMPEMTGGYFVQHIRDLAGYQMTPIVFLTADEQAKQDNAELGEFPLIDWIIKQDGIVGIAQKLNLRILELD